MLDHTTGLVFLTCDPMRRRYNTVMDNVIIDDSLTDGEIWLYNTEEVAGHHFIKRSNINSSTSYKLYVCASVMPVLKHI